MFTLRRWWDRNRLQVALVGAALGSAVLIRQTGAAFVFETYQLLTRPFHPQATQERILDNAQFQELKQRLTELESTNQKLQELLGYIKQNKQTGIPAPVVGRSSDHWWQQLVLGRGSNDGVKVGDVVMAPGGLIGRITHVTSNTSRVLLLSDPSSRVGVTVSRTRSMGYVRGQSANRLVMEFFDKVPDVRRGDVVATSSFSQLFPAGLPVGRVESVNLNKSPAPEAVIELSSPVAYLEWAVIYSHSGENSVGTPTTPNLDAPIPGVAPGPSNGPVSPSPTNGGSSGAPTNGSTVPAPANSPAAGTTSDGSPPAATIDTPGAASPAPTTDASPANASTPEAPVDSGAGTPTAPADSAPTNEAPTPSSPQ
jgi:rod shape-determining protein MreC